MTRYFVNPKKLCACRIWTETEDEFSDSFVWSVLANGYIECGWLRYQWYKWWKAR